MSETNTDQEVSFRSILRLLAEALATRSQIAGIELSMATDNLIKVLLNGLIAVFFAGFALLFISLALLIIFWDTYRIAVVCSLAVIYLVLFYVFLGKCRGYAANLPLAFAELRQILTYDIATLRNTLNAQSQTQEKSE